MASTGSTRERIPAIEGYFTLDEDAPRLIGTRCESSGTYFFPPEHTASRAPGHDGPLVEVELSRTGKVWSYTSASYQPPEPFITPTEEFEPFTIAAVHLEAEQITVLGQCVSGVTPDDLQVGDEMELVLDVLYSDDEADHLIWKWKPIETSQEAQR